MSEKKTGSRKFGAFAGVFVPTFLSIVGVILFLRLGYIVGGAGLLGTVAIILIATSVTFSTGLSISSIASNIRIGAGGAYSIISKTLGLEIGGSIGIPLYLAQSFSVALYLFGFAEAWQFIFPHHSLTITAIITFSVILILSLFSTEGVIKVQNIVFILICFSLITVYIGGTINIGGLSVASQPAEGPSFWKLFAIFFPAVTGLMAGVGMSGELSDPKRQIPKGILYSLAITLIIYLVTAIILAYNASPEILLTDTLILSQISIIPEMLIAGILAATFSSALTMFLAAPRVMQALSENSLLPFSNKLKKKSAKGEPRNSIIVTGMIVFPLLVTSSLDSVAQILTMFFLITYTVINIAVFIEQKLGLRSFRPLFRIPKVVPLYGAITSFVIMFLINPYASIVAFISIFIIYVMIARKAIDQESGDVRSGLFRSLSQWAEEKTHVLPESSLHIWKPNILAPVVTSKTLISNFPLIKSIAYPHGRITILGLRLIGNTNNPEKKNISKKESEKELKELPHLVEKFSEEKLFTTYSTIDSKHYIETIIVSLEAIESQSFAPNILVLPYKPDKTKADDIKRILNTTQRNKCGLILFDKDEEIGLGTESEIHVWISPKTLDKNLFAERYYDLALLIAYSIKKNWNGKIHIWMCVEDEEMSEKARRYLNRLIYEARFPRTTDVNIVLGDFKETLAESPREDIHIIPFEDDDLGSIIEISNIDDKSYLFVKDSTKESVLA